MRKKSVSIPCPDCGNKTPSEDRASQGPTKVYGTQQFANAVWRYVVCNDCGCTWLEESKFYRYVGKQTDLEL